MGTRKTKNIYIVFILLVFVGNISGCGKSDNVSQANTNKLDREISVIESDDENSTEKEFTNDIFYWESEKYFYLIAGEWIAEEYAGSIRDNHFDEAKEEWYQEEMQEYTDGVIEKYLGSEWCIEINNLEYLGPYVDLKFIMEDNSELFNIARLNPEENITINPPYIGLSAQLKGKDERYRFIIDTDGTVLIEIEHCFFKLEKKLNS